MTANSTYSSKVTRKVAGFVFKNGKADVLLLEIYLVDPLNIRPPVFIPEGHIVSFGRSESADICCDFDERISRIHFAIENKGDSAEVRDLYSTSGTLLNGLHVGEAKLHNSDTIRAGRTIFGIRMLELVPEGVHSVLP